jgi:hypothetical protein
MRYEARVSAYDMFGQIQVSASLQRTPQAPGDSYVTLVSKSVLVDGRGISDPEEWLRDALTAILETL